MRELEKAKALRDEKLDKVLEALACVKGEDRWVLQEMVLQYGHACTCHGVQIVRDIDSIGKKEAA